MKEGNTMFDVSVVPVKHSGMLKYITDDFIDVWLAMRLSAK